MPFPEHRVDSLPLLLAQAQVLTPAPWTYLGPATAPRSEDQLLNKKRNAAVTTTYAYTVPPLVIGLHNAHIRDQGESPLPPLPPPLREVCPFLLPFLLCLLFLFILLRLLPLLKSSMRQKTKFRCK